MDLAPTTAGLVTALTVSRSAPPELIRLDGELVQAWTALKAAQQTIICHARASARMNGGPAVADPLAMAKARRAIDQATKALNEYEGRTA